MFFSLVYVLVIHNLIITLKFKKINKKNEKGVIFVCLHNGQQKL